MQQEPIYPNFFIILVGRSGSGKTRPIVVAKRMLRRTGTNIAPSSITKEHFLSKMAHGVNDEKVSGWRKMDDLGDGMPYINSCVSVLAEELANFVKEGDTLFMDILTDLYDAADVWQNQTKTAGEDNLENVCVNVLGAITPQGMQRVLPEGAFKEGFASRLTLIFAVPGARKSLFGGNKEEYEAGKLILTEDLEAITQIEGEFHFTPAAAKQFDEWYRSGMRPEPTHPRLASYNERRQIHLAKLMMVVSASYSNARIINEDHLREASMYLLEAESYMPMALQAMGEETQGQQYSEAIIYLARHHTKTGKPMVESEFRSYLLSRVPAHYIRAAVEELIQSDYIDATDAPKGQRLFTPGPMAATLLRGRGDKEATATPRTAAPEPAPQPAAPEKKPNGTHSPYQSPEQSSDT